MKVKIAAPRVALIAALFLSILLPAPVSANGGPLSYPADAYGLLQLDDQSNISLVQEKVRFKIHKDAYENEQAEVTVEYELRNKNDFNKQVEVIFLTPSKDRITVSEGVVKLETVAVTNVMAINWQAPVMETVIEPISGKELRVSSGRTEQEAAGTRFSLIFKPGEKKSIRIQYEDRGGMYKKGVIRTIYSQLYYLTPAKYWEGEPRVELEVVFADAGSRIHSNLPMKRIDSHTYKASLNELPEKEWYFSYLYPKRLLFPTNVERDHNLLVLGTTVVLIAIAAGVALWVRRSSIFLFSAVGIIGFTVYYISKMGGYPFNPIFVGFTDVTVGVCLIACYFAIRRKLKRT